jgi:Protein of unknown function (DUF2971)
MPDKPERLYKYLDFSGTVRTLHGRAVKFSRPRDFNDPFDINLEEVFGAKYEDYHEGLKEAQFEFICSEIDYSKLRDNANKAKIILLNRTLRAMTDEQRKHCKQEHEKLPIEELFPRERTKQLQEEMIETLNKDFDAYGVFCAAQRCDDLLMWAHYAQKHTGAVLEFSPKEDSMFQASRLVNYLPERPLLYRTPQDFIRRSNIMPEEEATSEMIHSVLFTKSPEWSYEREYRLAIPKLLEDHKTPFETLRFAPEELTTVYLGCRMATNQRTQVVVLAQRINSKVEILQAKTAKREYGLEFTSAL